MLTGGQLNRLWSILKSPKKTKKGIIFLSFLAVIIIFSFFVIDTPIPEREGFFNKENYLFGVSLKEGEVIESANIVDGQFLESAAPPFLLEGTSFAAVGGDSLGKEMIKYEVKKGDSVSLVAEKFGISANTILWANNLSQNSTISPGDELMILPVSGVLHIVDFGETLSGIAALYDVNIEKIVKINSLNDPGNIHTGDFLVVPGAREITARKNIVRVPVPGNYFICPIPSPCRVTQGLHWYNAVDFSNGVCGEPVFAAAGGKVQVIGQNAISGNFVRIIHPNNVITFYGHLSYISVVSGQNVRQGDVIGHIGHTGYTIPSGAAGCHLHFDVRFASNPFAGYGYGQTIAK